MRSSAAFLWASKSKSALEAFFQALGFFPIWPLAWGETGTMVGASGEIVIADGYLKDITDFDAETVYQGLRAAAMDTVPPKGGRGGRDQVEPYMQYGYVPESPTQSKQSAMLDGKPMTSALFHHADLAKGAAFTVVMGTSPSQWGNGG